MSSIIEWNSLFNNPEEIDDSNIDINITAIYGLGPLQALRDTKNYTIAPDIKADTFENFEIPIPSIIKSQIPLKPIYYSLSNFSANKPLTNRLVVYPGPVQYDANLSTILSDNPGSFFKLKEFIEIPIWIQISDNIDITMFYNRFDEPYPPKVDQLASVEETITAINKNILPKGNVVDIAFVSNDTSNKKQFINLNLSYEWIGSYNHNTLSINWIKFPNDLQADARHNDTIDKLQSNIKKTILNKIIDKLESNAYQKNKKNLAALAFVSRAFAGLDTDNKPCGEDKLILVKKEVQKNIDLEIYIGEQTSSISVQFPGANRPVNLSKYAQDVTYVPPPQKQRPSGWHGGGSWSP